MPVLEEAKTVVYVTNHNMITMAMVIFKHTNGGQGRGDERLNTHIRYYDIKCGLIAHAQGLMGESVAFFMFQIDLLHSTGTEHIMYLASVKYKQYLTQGIEHYVEKIFTSLHFHDSFLIYLL